MIQSQLPIDMQNRFTTPNLLIKGRLTLMHSLPLSIHRKKRARTTT